MVQSDILQTIIKDSNYNLSLFSAEEIEKFRAKVFPKIIRGKETAFVNCFIRNKGFTIRFPFPEAYFLHKLIIARKRQSGAKRGKDLEQCTVIMPIINDKRIQQIARAQRFSTETRRHIAASCDVIGFPLHRIGLS